MEQTACIDNNGFNDCLENDMSLIYNDLHFPGFSGEFAESRCLQANLWQPQPAHEDDFYSDSVSHVNVQGNVEWQACMEQNHLLSYEPGTAFQENNSFGENTDLFVSLDDNTFISLLDDVKTHMAECKDILEDSSEVNFNDLAVYESSADGAYGAVHSTVDDANGAEYPPPWSYTFATGFGYTL